MCIILYRTVIDSGQFDINYKPMLHQTPISLSKCHCAKKQTNPQTPTTIHLVQVTTMLATSKDVLFPGHSHLLTTGTDDPTL